MMNSRRILNYVVAEPFRPFRIKMVSGETIEVRHPEMIAVGKTTVRISVWAADADSEPRERERELSILLIESIEVEESSVRQS